MRLAELLGPPGDLELRCMSLLEMFEFLPPEFASDELRALLETAQEDIQSKGVPTTRDAVMAVMAEDFGTGSVLDVDPSLADDSAATVQAVELDANVTEALYGTTTPALSDVLENSSWHPEERNTCRYVIAHDRGVPTAVVFAGLTSDR